jgi:uncharacterized protein GlcG (DUF336 family)
MVLKLAEAKKIIDGATAKARELKVEISVAVCDHECRLIALNRMDGVWIAEASHMAIGKAIASAVWGVPSHEQRQCQSQTFAYGRRGRLASDTQPWRPANPPR